MELQNRLLELQIKELKTNIEQSERSRAAYHQLALNAVEESSKSIRPQIITAGWIVVLAAMGAGAFSLFAKMVSS